MTSHSGGPPGKAQVGAWWRGEIPGWVLGLAFVVAVLVATWALNEPTVSRWIADLSAR